MTRTGSTFVFIAATIALSGCGRADHSDRQGGAEDAAGIEVTAAPGVAFRYDYAFRLPAARIAGAQERHAAGCERLGVTRCRITAMRYTRSLENKVDAELQFSIAPELARTFGRSAIAVVESNEGGIQRVEVVGENVAAQIGATNSAANAAAAERQSIDARIASSSGPARAELERQRGELGRAVADANQQAAAQRTMLKATPMVFHYESGKASPGFEAPSPFAQSLDLFNWSAGVTFSTLTNLLGLLLPPALLAAMLAALILGGRRLIRRQVTPVG